MTGIKRIRWDKEPEGGIVTTGHVHLLDTALFEIYPPTADDDRWILTSHLPGWHNRYFTTGADAGPEPLKDEAEAWLRAFLASIGTVFPDVIAADLRPHAGETEAAAGPDPCDRRDREMFAGGMRRAADLIERGDQPPESERAARTQREP